MIYQIPTIKDVPKSFNVTLLKDDGKTKPCSTVYSSKGIGEPGMIMCANILSAIRQAVAAHRKVICLSSNGFNLYQRILSLFNCNEIKMLLFYYRFRTRMKIGFI